MPGVPETMRWLSVSQAARRLDVDRVTVMRWRRVGRLRGCRCGRFWLIARRDVDALAAGLERREAQDDGSDH